MPEHAPFTHEHPALIVALNTRTRLLGTLNVAIALRGRSCGWGSCERPRRTFLGRVPRRLPDTGHHFIELVAWHGPAHTERVIFRLGDARPKVEIERD